MDDPTILTGISQIVNKKKTDNKLNLDAIEKDLIESGCLEKIKIQKNDKVDIGSIAREIRSRPKTHRQVESSYESDSDSVIDESDSEEESDSDDDVVDEERLPYKNHAPSSMRYPQSVQSPRSMRQPSYNMQPQQPLYNAQHQQPSYNNMRMQPQQRPYMGGNMGQNMGGNMGQNSYINDTLNAYAGNNAYKDALAEQEHLEEQKERMLADIDDLIDELKGDGLDVSRIPELTMDSRYDAVRKVYKTVKRKYDRSRCEDLGRGFMIAGAQAVEMAFDGQKSYFGYSPDMRGWHRTVRSKMRRLGYEQSVLVSDIMEKYEVSPFQRIMMELVPGAFLYSFTRKQQHGQDNYYPEKNNTGARSAALSDLREFDD